MEPGDRIVSRGGASLCPHAGLHSDPRLCLEEGHRPLLPAPLLRSYPLDCRDGMILPILPPGNPGQGWRNGASQDPAGLAGVLCPRGSLCQALPREGIRATGQAQHPQKALHRVGGLWGHLLISPEASPGAMRILVGVGASSRGLGGEACGTETPEAGRALCTPRFGRGPAVQVEEATCGTARLCGPRVLRPADRRCPPAGGAGAGARSGPRWSPCPGAAQGPHTRLPYCPQVPGGPVRLPAHPGPAEG